MTNPSAPTDPQTPAPETPEPPAAPAASEPPAAPPAPEAPEATDPATPPATEPKPPWGDDFNAERAWQLVQDLRGDKARLQERLTAAGPGAKPDEAALQELQTRAAKADTDLAAAQKALYVERALRKHSLSDDFADFLDGDSEEDILARAERLASFTGTPKEPQPADPSGKPVPALAPGHGGEPATPFDPVAIAKAARRGR